MESKVRKYNTKVKLMWTFLLIVVKQHFGGNLLFKENTAAL